MTYKAEVYDTICRMKVFIVNGIGADEHDFVYKEDIERDPDDYGCGNMKATPIPPTDVVLKKYSITIEEYNNIADNIAKKLSFGRCGWCA